MDQNFRSNYSLWKRVLVGLVALSIASCASEEPAGLGPNSDVGQQGDALLIADLPPETQEVIETYNINTGILGELSAADRASLSVPIAEVRANASFASDFEHEIALSKWETSCLVDAGFPATLDERSGEITMRAEGIGEALIASKDDEICAAEATIRFPLRPPPQTVEDWQHFYDHQLEVAECLDGEGIGQDSVPSLDEYIDGNGFWTAYDVVPDDQPDGEWDRLNRQCPQ